MPPDTDCGLTLTKNALFKRWAFMAGDTEVKGQIPEQGERSSWRVGSKGLTGKYCEMDVEDCVRLSNPPPIYS